MVLLEGATTEGKLSEELWSTCRENTHGNSQTIALKFEDGGNVSNATSSETCNSYGKEEDEGKLGKLANN